MLTGSLAVNLNPTTNRIGIVAIVDDDADIREALASLLMASSFTIDTFSTAEAFLQFPHRKEVRCLILDVHLPGMNGVELQKRLLDAAEKVPIVFISGNVNNSFRHLAMKAVSDGFLHK